MVDTGNAGMEKAGSLIPLYIVYARDTKRYIHAFHILPWEGLSWKNMEIITSEKVRKRLANLQKKADFPLEKFLKKVLDKLGRLCYTRHVERQTAKTKIKKNFSEN